MRDVDIPMDRVLLATGHHPLTVPVVLAHSARLTDGGVLDPALVERRPDGLYALLDGRHRYAAALLTGQRTLEAEMTEQLPAPSLMDDMVRSVERVDLRPGDVVCVRVASSAPGVGQRVGQRAAETFPGHSVFVLLPGDDLFVVSAADAEQIEQAGGKR